MHTRVKICGICREVDLDAAVDAGADALGFVFHSPSPRHLALDVAERLSNRVMPFVSRVALFMDPEEQTVRDVISAMDPDILQFHGSESAAFCGSFGRPYIKTVGMQADTAQVLALIGQYPQAAGILLDGHAPGAAGGQGQTFDWSKAPNIEAPVVLAGGLSADNVAQAIRIARPYAVDVSSGVESEPGQKDPALIQRFLQSVREADQQTN